MPSPASRPSTARLGGLDGLRAIAVGLVLAYHLFPGVLPGGFLGVDVFFAISGFLITTLLLREFQAHGRIGLSGFWRRRARRLLPALALMLLVTTSLAALAGGDLLVGIGRQIAGTALFVNNWVSIATGSDYFTRDAPEVFRNTWSLSIEEQFYILLPLLLLLALLRVRSWQTNALLFGALGTASAVWMAELSRQGTDPTRIYFGSDTHTFGLLFGAAAAILLHRDGRGEAPRLSFAGQLGWLAAALAGLGTLGWLAATLPEASPQSFQGGFQLATLASILVVVAVTRDGAWAGRALDNAPMRWLGERSYGIYLWHWPLLLIVATVFAPRWSPWTVGLVTLAATLLVSALSFRYVEQPVRLGGLRASIKRAIGFRAESGLPRRVAIALGALLVVTVPATAFAIANAPRQSSAADAIARGQAELDQLRPGELLDAPPAPTAGVHGERDPGANSPKPEKGERPQQAEGHPKPPPPVSPEGRDISAVGDSVMLASLPELNAALPGIAVDASVSRGFGVGVDLYAQQSQQGALRRIVVAGLGTNGPVDPADLDRLLQIAEDRPVVLVNAYGERDWIPGVNQLLSDFAASHRGVVVADWQGRVSDVPDALAGDGIHPNPSGGEIYAASVGDALAELQTPEEAIGFKAPRR